LAWPPVPPRVIDFHLHTIFSDGQLAPAELGRRAFVKGYSVMGLSDHVDQSNLEWALERALLAAGALSGEIGLEPGVEGLKLLPSVELTHVPPPRIALMTARARELGAAYVVVHGESPVEPVCPGTNRAAILAKADILAHPGFLTPEEVDLAAQNGVRLELSARGGHNMANGLVAGLARRYGAQLLVNSDAHSPNDLLTPEIQMRVALGAGLSPDEYLEMMAGAAAWAATL
jgi:histidinol phosphatase-like PHP family hydrolase